jgi:hypothetical protein
VSGRLLAGIGGCSFVGNEPPMLFAPVAGSNGINSTARPCSVPSRHHAVKPETRVKFLAFYASAQVGPIQLTGWPEPPAVIRSRNRPSVDEPDPPPCA